MVLEKKDRLMVRFLAIIITSIFLTACFKDRDSNVVVNYDGPFMELSNIETIFTDSSILRVKLKAPKQQEEQNGDRKFPKGVYVEFYDEEGEMSATLKANSGEYKKDRNLYTVRGNVIIENKVEKKKLNTEELFWNPQTKKINTNKFVRIETPEEIITGEGLEATQDFSDYTILKPRGVFSVEQ
jgi:LPS export ABC transporter protein LptC